LQISPTAHAFCASDCVTALEFHLNVWLQKTIYQVALFAQYVLIELSNCNRHRNRQSHGKNWARI